MEIVTVWLLLLGFSRVQFVGRESEAMEFLKTMESETVRYAIARGDYTGQKESNAPNVRRYKGAEFDHYN